MGSENEEIINKRKNIIKDSVIINLERDSLLKARQTLKEKSEEYLFKIENGEKENYIRKLILMDKFKKNKRIRNRHIWRRKKFVI